MQKGVHNEDQKSLESSIRNKQLTFKQISTDFQSVCVYIMNERMKGRENTHTHARARAHTHTHTHELLQ